MTHSEVFLSDLVTPFERRCCLCGSTGSKFHPCYKCPLVCSICRCLDQIPHHLTKDHKCRYCDLVGGRSHLSEECSNKPSPSKPVISSESYPPISDVILAENGWDY